MKNKIKSILLLMLIVPCLFLFVACGKDNGNQNNNNNQTNNEEESNVKPYSEGLAYVLSSDETYYIVTGMGECDDLNIIIPDTYNGLPVKEIRNSAFSGYDILTSVTIGNNVTSIGKGAFNSCWTLISVTIGKNVTSIGESAFFRCENLVEIYNLSSLNIENGSSNYGDVGYYAEDIYTSLDEPSKLKTSNGMIYYVNDDEKIAMKPVDVFSPSVIIEEDCTEIHECVFELPWLTEIYNLSSIDIESMVDIKEDLYIYTSLDEPSKLKTSNGVIYYVTDKEKIAIRPETIIKYDLENNYFILDKEEIILDDDCTRIGEQVFISSNLTNITIPNSVTSIGEDAFRGCSGLTSVTIPNSVTSIGDDAFGCSGLTSVTIGNSVTSIGDYAFYGCYRLVEVYNLSNLNIEKGSKDNKNADSIEGNQNVGICSVEVGEATVVGSIDIDNGYVGYYAKDIYTSLDEPSKLKTSNGVIYYINGTEKIAVAPKDKNATSIVLDDDCTEINQGAFCDCSKLTAITIPNSVTSIGKYAFYNCSSLTSITIPDSVTNIGNGAFCGCDSLQEITLPFVVGSETEKNYLGYIFGASLYFFNSDDVPASLKKVTITKAISIGNSAFRGCSGLTSITIPDSVTSIGNSAFSGCSGLTSITIPNGVTSIGEDAFRGCSGLTSVTIGNSVTSIGEDAFDGCNRLVEIYNLSSLNIEKWSEDNGYVGYYAKDIYTSLDEPSKLKVSNGVIYYINGTEKIAVGLEDINATSIVIDNDCTIINEYAFYDCSSLTSVTIGNSVTSIRDFAFSGCSSLTNIIIPDSVTSIGDSAFKNCSSLTSIIIPNSVTSIENSAFSGCSSLTNVTIGNSVTRIGIFAFYNCSSLTSVTIGNSVIRIGNYAFSYCSSLTSVTIPNSVTIIGIYAFYRCSSLTSVKLENTTGWKISDVFQQDSSSLSSLELSDINKAALYLTSNFYDCVWERG